MAVMNEIMECHGDNTYEIPHLNKTKLEKEGTLPITLPVSNVGLEYLGLK